MSPSKPNTGDPARLLVTAGPTHEPIDAVRYLANRSSGRTGLAIADEGARRGWAVTLLLGPTHLGPTHAQIRTRRFQTTADLEMQLAEESPRTGVLIMAAAVADYRPTPIVQVSSGAPSSDSPTGKMERSDDGLTLHLQSTPDLLAQCAARRVAGQLFVGFALQERADLERSARAKLARKNIDLIVANPLETMDAPTIEAVVLGRPGLCEPDRWVTPEPMPKAAFARWLLDLIEEITDGSSPFPPA